MRGNFYNFHTVLFLLLQRSADKKTNFLKVSAPWELLTKYAEILNLKMPIKVRKNTGFFGEIISNILKERSEFEVILTRQRRLIT